MTIEKYKEKDPDFDIYMECKLEFAEPDNSKEAMENIEYILNDEATLQALGVVVRSYYNGTIEWERF